MRENGVFFTPVKYTLACRAPQVSWAARHTTVCLDTDTTATRDSPDIYARTLEPISGKSLVAMV